MKKHFFAVVAFLVLCVPVVTSAATFKTGEQYTLSAGEVFADDLYVGSGQIVIAGDAREDVLVAGGKVLITGSIGKDLTAAGGNLDVLGNVGDDLRVAGGQVVLGGRVGGDLIAGGGTVTVLSDAIIVGRVVLAGGDVRFEGKSTKDLTVFGGRVTINGTSGNVSIKAQEEVNVGEKTVVNGNFTYHAPKEATIAEGSRISGETIFEEIEVSNFTEDPRGKIAALLGVFSVGMMLASIILGIVLVHFLTRTTGEAVSLGTLSFWKILLYGFIFLIVTPVLAIVLCLTFIGCLVAIPVFLLYGLAIVFAIASSGIIFAVLIEKHIFKREGNLRWYTPVWGTPLLCLIGLIPLAGGLVKAGFFVAAVGAWSKTGKRILSGLR